MLAALGLREAAQGDDYEGAVLYEEFEKWGLRLFGEGDEKAFDAGGMA